MDAILVASEIAENEEINHDIHLLCEKDMTVLVFGFLNMNRRTAR